MATQSTSRLASGLTAYQQAVRALIDENRGRFGELLREKRVAAGLPAVSGGKSPAQIRKQMEKAQKRLATLEAELARYDGNN